MISSDKWNTNAYHYMIQWITVAVQHGNAVSVLGTLGNQQNGLIDYVTPPSAPCSSQLEPSNMIVFLPCCVLHIFYAWLSAPCLHIILLTDKSIQHSLFPYSFWSCFALSYPVLVIVPLHLLSNSEIQSHIVHMYVLIHSCTYIHSLSNPQNLAVTFAE